MLPHNDQDRIIAAELLMSYRNWKRLLAVITTHAIISEERILVEKPFSYIDINGRDTCVLTVNGHIDPVKSIQELPITHTQKFEYARHGLLIMGVSVPTSDITIEEPTLIRHDAMTPIREKKDIVRASVFKQLGYMPAYKRRSI